MAKKPVAKEAKKRKGVTASAKAAPAEDAVMGSILIPIQVGINVGAVAQFNEMVVEWGCLGLSEEPDVITEVSGNSHLLDPKRPPYTDADGLHVFFNPPLAGGTHYGFLFHALYTNAVEVRTAVPKTDEELEKEQHEREAA